jgi:hypothetical protein
MIIYLKSEIKVALFLFASHSFLANNLRFMVKLIVKTIVINGKIPQALVSDIFLFCENN